MYRKMAIFALLLGLVALVVAPGCTWLAFQARVLS